MFKSLKGLEGVLAKQKKHEESVFSSKSVSSSEELSRDASSVSVSSHRKSKQKGIWIISGVKEEVPVLLMHELLVMVSNRLELFLGTSFDDETILAECTVISYLLDEMFDAGFPMTLEPNQLTCMINAPTLVEKVTTTISGKPALEELLPKCTSSSLPWRNCEVKYLSNDLYIDILETLDVTTSSSGTIVQSRVRGRIECNCRLSGTPDLSIVFFNPSLFNAQNCCFHRCVRLNQFLSEKVVSFVPPDGKFTLMEYVLPGPQRFPIKVDASLSSSTQSGSLRLRIYPNIFQSFDLDSQSSSTISSVSLQIPLPEACLGASFSVSSGSVQFEECSKVCTWKIPKLSSECCLDGSLTLNEKLDDQFRLSISAGFQVTGYAPSGVKIDEIITKNIDYAPYKGAKSVCSAGNFFIRF